MYILQTIFFLSISMPFKDIWIGMNEKDFLRNENWLGLLCGLGITSLQEFPFKSSCGLQFVVLMWFFFLSCWLFVIDKKILWFRKGVDLVVQPMMRLYAKYIDPTPLKPGGQSSKKVVEGGGVLRSKLLLFACYIISDPLPIKRKSNKWPKMSKRNPTDPKCQWWPIFFKHGRLWF